MEKGPLDKQTEELLTAYFRGELEGLELQRVEAWLAESEEHRQQYRRRHTSPFPHRFHVRPSCYCSHCTTVIFSVDSPVSAATASVTARRTALLPAP